MPEKRPHVDPLQYAQVTERASALLRQHYTQIARHRFRSHAKVLVGTSNPRRCRYCGRGDGDTTFRKRAHVVPEFLGNRSILSTEECDSCNAWFGAEYDTHMAAMLTPFLTAFRIRGKRGLPTYKSRSGKSLMEGTSGGLLFMDAGDGELFDWDRSRGEVTLTMDSQRFIPRRAFKSIVKSAVGLLPSELLSDYKKTIDWLRSADDTATWVRPRECVGSVIFLPGNRPHGDGSVFLLRRKSDARSFPDLVLVLAVSNLQIQVFVPLGLHDDRRGSRINVVVPPPWISAEHDIPLLHKVFLDGSSYVSSRFAIGLGGAQFGSNPGEPPEPFRSHIMKRRQREG